MDPVPQPERQLSLLQDSCNDRERYFLELVQTALLIIISALPVYENVRTFLRILVENLEVIHARSFLDVLPY
jgi:hypothetical protein